MQIFHLNANDKEGGAARAVYRLHRGLFLQDFTNFVLG